MTELNNESINESINDKAVYRTAGLYIKNTHNNFHCCTSRISPSISVNFTIFALF